MATITMMMLYGILSMPVLAHAQASVESDFAPWAVGDRGKSRGMFQVQARHWGKVPRSVIGQMKQYNSIIVSLYNSHHSMEKAIKAYNGTGRKADKYYVIVRARVLGMEILGVI